ncbi:enoyl-CoA hydratase/isomerase family protein [Leptospira sp. GIMC2001]|uniref:enoyl-CoA hydratase/isomerase family protein n=1 Tax=Leptospira sp. GIMC2001 TaxID=1513297 RepID=UPI00234A26F5|nr:enoyl-CoA hydratase/isomerase family protein [Leptospira sp. GIMC2001]WCL48785.1 enoyl-CoA hydratase/isomerase family protein [Leptospira sp. GIMC2001]
MIDFKIEDGIGIVELNINEGNSFDLVSFAELDRIINQIQNKSMYALIIRSSRSGVFSQGLDLQTLKNESDPKKIEDFLSYFFGILKKIYDLPIPVLSEIGGHALGYGAMIGLASDYRFGLEGSRWGLPEVKLGIRVPSFITFLLMNVIGQRLATQHVLEGNAIKTADAFRMGILDEIYKDTESLKTASLKFAKKFSKNSHSATVSTKQGFRYLDRDLSSIIDQDKRLTFDILNSPDAKEGIDSATSGRRPEFKSLIL